VAEIGPDVSAGLPSWIYGHLDAIQGQDAQDHASPPQEPPQEPREVEGELQTWLDRADAHAPLQPLTEDFYLPGDFQTIEAENEIVLPNNWEPRFYQRSLWGFLMNGGVRASLVAHRRWGKDDLCLHWTCCAAHMRVGNYWHMLPQANQARKAIWTAVNPHSGKRRIDEAFPEAVRAKTRDDEMAITFRNGSTWQVLGSDNFDALVGSPPLGLVFSEWALADPLAWGMLRPILLENGGWALFIGTPRGHNHAEKTHKLARKSKEWFGQLQTVEDTDVFTREQLRMEREELISEHGQELGQAIFEQEYYCSFNAATPGAYFTLEMRKMREKRRIVDTLPALQGLPVHTYWDIGVRDRTAIVFVQKDGPRELIVDYYEASNRGVDHYAQVLEDKRKEHGYFYGAHIGPHDLEERVWGTVGARKVINLAEDVGIKFRVAPKLSKLDSINHVRRYLGRCWIAADKCSRLISALEQHHASHDESKDLQSAAPEHDWTSHPVDAIKYGAQSPAWYFTQSWEDIQTGEWGQDIEYQEAGVI